MFGHLTGETTTRTGWSQYQTGDYHRQRFVLRVAQMSEKLNGKADYRCATQFCVDQLVFSEMSPAD